jgi:putative transposase
MAVHFRKAFDLLPSFRTKLSMISSKERERSMSRSNHTEAQMIGALKQLEAGRKAEDVAREVGVSKHTIYAWKAKYGRMDMSEAQEAKQLRDENTKLKKLVVDLSLDKEMLKAVIAKNGWARRPAVGCELAAEQVCSQGAPGLRAAGDGGRELPVPNDTQR